MENKIVIAGFGGQGVVFSGDLLAKNTVLENLNVTKMISYGVEMRGGTANCTIIISDDEIASPVIDTPNIALLMNPPSLIKFEDKIEKNGLLIINSTLVLDKVKRKDLQVFEVPATMIAKELGNVKVANLVMLGALIKNSKIFKIEDFLNNLDNIFPENKKHLLEINKKAIMKGYDYLN